MGQCYFWWGHMKYYMYYWERRVVSISQLLACQNPTKLTRLRQTVGLRPDKWEQLALQNGQAWFRPHEKGRKYSKKLMLETSYTEHILKKTNTYLNPVMFEISCISNCTTSPCSNSSSLQAPKGAGKGQHWVPRLVTIQKIPEHRRRRHRGRWRPNQLASHNLSKNN